MRNRKLTPAAEAEAAKKKRYANRVLKHGAIQREAKTQGKCTVQIPRLAARTLAGARPTLARNDKSTVRHSNDVTQRQLTGRR